MDIVAAFRLHLEPGSPDIVSFVGGGGKTATLFRLASAIAERGQRVITTTTTHLAASQVSLAPAALFVEDEPLPLAQIETALQQHRHCLLVSRSTTHDPGDGRVGGLSNPQIMQLVSHAQTLNLSALLMEADGSRHKPVKAPGAHEPVVPPCTTLLVPVLGLDGVGRPIDEQFVHRPDRVRALVAPNSAPPPSRLTPARAAQLLIHPDGGAKQLPANARLLPLLNKVDLPGTLGTARLVARELAASGHSCLLGATGSEPGDAIVERWGPLAVVILAAGRSSRMGRPKQVEVVDGEAMVVRSIQIALQSAAQHLYLVTGAYATEVKKALAAWPQRVPHLQVIHNPLWEQGQSTSVHRALTALPPAVEAVSFLPVDQPFVPHTLLRRLQQRWRAGSNLVVPAIQHQPRGAPALFDRTLWTELQQIAGDSGGRHVIQAHRATLEMIPVSPKDLFDIDTPADLPRP